MGTTSAASLRQHTNVRGFLSVGIGLAATACAMAAIATTNLVVGAVAVVAAAVGFPIGWQAHTRALSDVHISKRWALAGEVLNFAPWALLVLWGFVVYAYALISGT